MKVIPVILCGGSGSRLWPLSRENYPKQLLALVNERSLLQNTVSRCQTLPDIAEPILVCNEEHRFLVAEQMRALDVDCNRIILEPAGRNTAPAVALAAHAVTRDEDAILVVLPSDHVIGEQERFIDALTTAVELARQDHLVTFGIVPDRAETGYGYIRQGEAMQGGYRVAEFVEKPDEATARQFVSAGDYHWNSGMFVFKASVYLSELTEHNPDMSRAMGDATSVLIEDLDFTRVDEVAFLSSPSDSIDYAVMERTAAAVVVPLDAAWNDVGSWDALWGISARDEDGNVLLGDVVTHEVSHSYIRAEHRLVSVIGLDDVVVVETADAVLVASQSQAQQVKHIVNQLSSDDRVERSFHRKVFRPWGYYEGVDEGPDFQVKRISVEPGASLSLQLHRQRAEHWVVVNGTATVTIDQRTFELHQNESTYIPIETRHRLQNLTGQALEIIEVQSGEYLGEDDIERFDDNYGR